LLEVFLWINFDFYLISYLNTNCSGSLVMTETEPNYSKPNFVGLDFFNYLIGS